MGNPNSYGQKATKQNIFLEKLKHAYMIFSVQKKLNTKENTTDNKKPQANQVILKIFKV